MHFLRLPYQSDGTKSWIYFSVSTVIGVCLLLIWQLNVFASDANGFGPTFKTGHVYARGILLGQNGQPIFAEYNEQGQVVQQYGEAVGEYEGARIISADDYKFQYARYLDFLSEFRTSKARAANILTREEYIGTDFPAVSLPDINGQSGDTIEVPVTKPVLAAGVQSVLVRNQNTIVTRDIAENDLVLFSATIDLRAAEEALGDDAEFPDQTTKSLLLNSRGQILHRSSVDIGLRTAFWNRQDGSQFSNTELDGRNGYGAGDTPIAPISEALVYPDMQWHSRGHTDENGQFSLYYFLPPCPGFSWFYDYNLIGEIPYRNFNPKSRAWQPWAVYYTTVPVGDRCDGTALNLSTATDLTGQSVYNTLVGINASSPQPIVRADMPVVANMITGIGMLTNDGQNPVELGERTEYAVNGSIANTPTLPENLDLDANEVADDVRLGEDGKVEVRFDGDSENPDFTRLVDTVPDFSSQGLLKTLKPEDLSDTDLYVYRQSTGQLLVDREGLRNEEYGTYNLICAETDPDCVADGEDATNRFFYQMLIRGRWYFDYLAGALPDYQSKTRINEELRGLDSNHLRPGEEIKLVAINRKTGYIGTALAKVKVGGVENNALSFDIPPLMLQPPNLKIEAKRTTEVEAGLTRGEERQYTIGSEGAGLTSDKTVVVTTEWVDQDGSPLPEDLPGYTGRLAQVIDTNELGVPTSKLSNFAIRPGRRTQIIRLTEDDELGREHFYIHVSGEPIDGNPSFARVSGAGEGPLLYRPDYYVPIRVPIFDEEATRQVRNELRYAQKEELTNLTLDDIDPVYHWPHRPEMQFSVFDLDVNRIAGLDESEDGVSEDIQTIIYDPNSLSDCERDSETLLQCFLNNADVVTFEYALFSDSIDPLPTIGPDRTLVLSLGGEEVTIGPQYGADQTIRFEDPEHLRHLDAADYLTIALFQNNDAENLLWEFDLVKAALVVDQNRDGVIQLEDPDPAGPPVSQINSEQTLSDSILPSALAQTGEPVALIEKDRNSPENPFRWWFNDDDDSGNVMSKNLVNTLNLDIPGRTNPLPNGRVENGMDNRVNGKRDLVDFFPVFVDVREALRYFPTDEYEYRISHAQEMVRVVYTNFDSAEAGESRVDGHLELVGHSTQLQNADSILLTKDGIALDQEFLKNVELKRGGVILVEASRAFDEPEEDLGCRDNHEFHICTPITLSIHRKRLGLIGRSVDDRKINGEANLHIEVTSVEDMFRHLNLRSVIADPEVESVVPDRLSEPLNNPDTAENESYIVWVSGYNVTEQANRGWQSEIFKRLYSLGLEARFIGVTWAGDLGGFSFPKAVYSALSTSKSFAEQISSIVGELKTTILGHSAGNLLVSNAISTYGYTPNSYIMLDAAVPIEAYSSSQDSGRDGENMRSRMTEELWKPYLDIGVSQGNEFGEVFASNWSKLWSSGDARSSLSWQGVFSKVLENTDTYNFYSSGEDVLENAYENEEIVSTILAIVQDGGVLNGRHSWVLAQLLMGCEYSVAGLVYDKPAEWAGDENGNLCMGGWSFNDREEDLEKIGVARIAPGFEGEYSIPTPFEAQQMVSNGDLTTLELKQIGLFKNFTPQLDDLLAPEQGEPDIADRGRSFQNSQLIAAQDSVRSLLLSYAVPPLSFPVGSNPISRLGPIRNYDMNANQNTWPEERTSNSGYPASRWLHSDIREVALVYAANVFNQIIEIHE